MKKLLLIISLFTIILISCKDFKSHENKNCDSLDRKHQNCDSIVLDSVKVDTLK